MEDDMDGWSVLEEHIKNRAVERGKPGYTKIDHFPLRLEPEEEARITFLSKMPEFRWLHSVPRENGKFRDKGCIGIENGCEYCRKEKPRRRGVATIVDHRRITYTNRNGVEVEEAHVVRYLNLVPNVALKPVMVAFAEQKTHLAGLVFNICRRNNRYPDYIFETRPHNPIHHPVPPGAMELDFDQVFGPSISTITFKES